jgi:hypothetical protein
MAVRHRVEVDVIHVPFHIRLVANFMFPEAPLPDAFFAFGEFTRRAMCCRIETSQEQAFDGVPAPTEIGVAIR